MLAGKNLVEFSSKKDVGLKGSKGFLHSSHIFLPKVFIFNCDMSDKICSHLSLLNCLIIDKDMDLHKSQFIQIAEINSRLKLKREPKQAPV